MTLPLGFLIRSRHPDVITCVLLFIAGGAAMVGGTTILFGIYGPPSRWPPFARLGVVALVLLAAFGWWWVNASVEGPIVVQFSDRHGITVADLLALPALTWGAYVLTARARRPR